jgi:hypothetical protein
MLSSVKSARKPLSNDLNESAESLRFNDGLYAEAITTLTKELADLKEERAQGQTAMEAVETVRALLHGPTDTSPAKATTGIIGKKRGRPDADEINGKEVLCTSNIEDLFLATYYAVMVAGNSYEQGRNNGRPMTGTTRFQDPSGNWHENIFMENEKGFLVRMTCESEYKLPDDIVSYKFYELDESSTSSEYWEWREENKDTIKMAPHWRFVKTSGTQGKFERV